MCKGKGFVAAPRRRPLHIIVEQEDGEARSGDVAAELPGYGLRLPILTCSSVRNRANGKRNWLHRNFLISGAAVIELSCAGACALGQVDRLGVAARLGAENGRLDGARFLGALANAAIKCSSSWLRDGLPAIFRNFWL